MQIELFREAGADPGLRIPADGDRVAIVTRTKDRPILLARALASVLAQSHQAWHLYLVNDGGDPAAVDALAETYGSSFAGRLTVIHHPVGRGMEAASNAALAAAAGDFVVVHDDDDSWHPEFLKETTSFLRSPANARFAAVVTNCMFIAERIEGDRVVEEQRLPWGFWQDHVAASRLLVGNTIPPITLLARKAVCDRVGPFNEQLPVLGDWDYNLRIMLVGDIGTIARPLAYYHHRGRDEAGSYGNTVDSGRAVHDLYNTLFRNGLVRQFVEADPSRIGLIQALLHDANSVENRLRGLLERNNDWNEGRFVRLQGEFARLREVLSGMEATLARPPEPSPEPEPEPEPGPDRLIEVEARLGRIEALLARPSISARIGRRLAGAAARISGRLAAPRRPAE